MAVDLSVYQNQKTLGDYINAAQDRNNQQQAQRLDLESKKNIYATQLLSSAVDQNSYDMIRQHLAQGGIDTSGFAPDFETGKQQAYQARLAQSPLGSLLNAGMHAESILNSGASTFGSAGAAAAQDPMSAALARGIGGMLGGQVPQDRPVVSDGRNAPSSLPPQLPQGSNADPQAEFQASLAQAQNKNGVSPAQNPALQSVGQNPIQPFSFRTQEPGESISSYQNARNQAFEQYKANPDYISKVETAKGIGTAGGEEAKMLDIMSSGLPLMLKRFQNIRDATNDASSGFAEMTRIGPALANAGMFPGAQKTADANALLTQNASQNILGELGPQLAQAGVRGNKFLEQIANQASGMDMSAPPSTKQKLVNGLESTYIANLKSVANQVRLKGLPAPSDAEIDAQVNKLKSSLPSQGTPESTGGWSIKRVK